MFIENFDPEIKKKCAQRGSHTTDTNTTQLITQQTELEKF